MKKLEEIDQNFAQNNDNRAFIFHDIRTEPFRIYGLYEPQKKAPSGVFRKRWRGGQVKGFMNFIP